MAIDYSCYKNLKVEIANYIATVTFNRAESLNAFDTQLHLDVEMVFADLSSDDSIRAVIVTGAGKAFSAGGDIKMMKTWIDHPETPMSLPIFNGLRIINNLVDCPKPVIAAVNGHAMGLGATVALCCDIVIASENARFADPHVRVGLSADDGGCVIWPLLISLNKAKEFLFTGDQIEAKEAEKLGLINKVVPPEQVMPTALAMAQRLSTEISPIAVKYTKMSVNTILKERINTLLSGSYALGLLSRESKDHAEAINAFLEKRKPNFTNT